MIQNRTDFYFDDNSLSWSTDYMPRLLAVVDAWLSCSVKIYREGFELMMALSRCRAINSRYVILATRQIDRYLKAIMKQNRDLERSWHRDPVNPQPGPVLVAEFRYTILDEDGVPCSSLGAVSNQGVTTATTDEGILSLVRLHYQQMHASLSADPRAHADDITRAVRLSLLDSEECEQEKPSPAVLDSSSVEKKATRRRRKK